MFSYEDGGNTNLLMFFFAIIIFGMGGVMAWLNLAERVQNENNADRPRMDIAPNPGAEFLDRIGYRGKIPPKFICPITLCIMHDPVCFLGGHDSHVFERSALEKWLSECNRRNPLTGELLPNSVKLISAKEIARQIYEWLRELRRSRLSSSVRLQGGGGTLRPKSKSKITVAGERVKRSTSSFSHS